MLRSFRQEISVLECRLHMGDNKLSLLDKLSQEVVTCIDVLRVRVACGVNANLNRTVVVLKNLDARVPKLSGKKKRLTDRRKRASLQPSAIATHSVSLEEIAVPFCVLEIH